MELTLEAYSIIVDYVQRTETRAALASLCSVSRLFRRTAEQALYREIVLENTHEIRDLCITLAGSPRLASLVHSLTIMPDDGTEEGSDDELPDDYWEWISKALATTQKLTYLNIHSHIGPTSACAWVYPKHGLPSLRTLYCDFDWDDDLVAFLNSRHELEDLYILDFKNPNAPFRNRPPTPPQTLSTTLSATALPRLDTLECTFSEAAEAIVPCRPIARLKTCLSETEMGLKRIELARLLKSLKLSARSLVSLDIADSSYSEELTMDLLRRIAGSAITSQKLRSLGTLVLPVCGPERLKFYGLLMRLRELRCVEVEVSEWDPAPATPAAFRALANELRMYCPLVNTVVFVHDLERTAVTASEDGHTKIDFDIDLEHLWREI